MENTCHMMTIMIFQRPVMETWFLLLVKWYKYTSLKRSVLSINWLKAEASGRHVISCHDGNSEMINMADKKQRPLHSMLFNTAVFIAVEASCPAVLTQMFNALGGQSFLLLHAQAIYQPFYASIIRMRKPNWKKLSNAPQMAKFQLMQVSSHPTQFSKSNLKDINGLVSNFGELHIAMEYAEGRNEVSMCIVRFYRCQNLLLDFHHKTI